MKTTKRDYLNALVTYFTENDAIVNNISAKELVNFANHELELLNNKSTRKAEKLTEKQKEDLKLMEIIYNAMEVELNYTIADLIAIVPELAGLNSQKVTPLVTKLVNAGKVNINKEKSRTRYTKVGE